mgnify:CR=1 FL=1
MVTGVFSFLETPRVSFMPRVDSTRSEIGGKLLGTKQRARPFEIQGLEVKREQGFLEFLAYSNSFLTPFLFFWRN